MMPDLTREEIEVRVGKIRANVRSSQSRHNQASAALQAPADMAWLLGVADLALDLMDEIEKLRGFARGILGLKEGEQLASTELSEQYGREIAEQWDTGWTSIGEANAAGYNEGAADLAATRAAIERVEAEVLKLGEKARSAWAHEGYALGLRESSDALAAALRGQEGAKDA